MTGKRVQVPIENACDCPCHSSGELCGYMPCCQASGLRKGKVDSAGHVGTVAQHRTVGGKGVVGRIKR